MRNITLETKDNAENKSKRHYKNEIGCMPHHPRYNKSYLYDVQYFEFYEPSENEDQ